jgi:hypothetical protein
MKLRRPSPSTLDRATSAAFWVTGVANALASEQLDVPGLFRDAGLDIAMLGDPDARFATEQTACSGNWPLRVPAIPRSGWSGLRAPNPGISASWPIR